MMASNIWITERSRGKTNATAIALLTLGIILAISFRHFDGPGLTESLAAFLLGLLLLIVGLGTLLFGGKQIITVNPKRRCIIIEGKNRFGTSTKSIRFNEIADVYVGEFGDQEGGGISYHVVAKLKTGKEIRLFFAFFDGQHNHSVAEARCRSLIQYLREAAS